MAITYINEKGKVVTRKIPRSATNWNGPLNCIWNRYDANGTGFDLFQDSWGRLA